MKSIISLQWIKQQEENGVFESQHLCKDKLLHFLLLKDSFNGLKRRKWLKSKYREVGRSSCSHEKALKRTLKFLKEVLVTIGGKK